MRQIGQSEGLAQKNAGVERWTKCAGSVGYVRVSVAGRCNPRCTYLMIDHMRFVPLETARQEPQSY